jgi:hypothetical protein
MEAKLKETRRSKQDYDANDMSEDDAKIFCYLDGIHDALKWAMEPPHSQTSVVLRDMTEAAPAEIEEDKVVGSIARGTDKG